LGSRETFRVLLEPLDAEKLCPNRFFQLWIKDRR
jgi:hypothetical protein